MAETAADRVVRMLALITYLQSRPGAAVQDVAEHFGVSTEQVLHDADTLWVSGTPGYMPDDLIDFSADDHERGLLTLTDARGMARPLRLGAQEAVALLTGLRSLRATPGLAQDPVLATTIEKLSAAAGQAAQAAEAVEVQGSDGDREVAQRLQQLRSALGGGLQVHLRYVSVSDEVTERDVDPLQLLTDSRHWFLIAWCHRAAGLRQFRLDRILALKVLDRPAQEHPGIEAARSAEPELSQAPWQVQVHLAAPARWVAERYPLTSVSEHADGSFTIELPVLDLAWLQRLVLGLGDAVLDVHPPQVAEHISAGAHRALAAYDADPPPGTGSPPTTGGSTAVPPAAPAGPDGGR